MRFGVPWGFLWLLGWGIVILLHFLRRRLREEEVSALFLWERAAQRPPSPREKLRTLWDLLLFLQLLAVGFLATAFAEPRTERMAPSGAVALVLDASASMRAQGLPAAVRRIASEIVRGSSGPWTVVAWADPPRYLVRPTPDRDEVLRGIARYAPTQGGRSSLGEALAYLVGEWGRIVVITDSPPREAVGLEVIALPRPEDLAITALSLRPQPDGSGYEAFIAVWNGTGAERRVPIVIRAGELSFREEIDVPPGAERGLAFPYFGPLDVGFVATLGTGDAFPEDDVRYLALGRRARVRARWIGDEDPFLRAALLAVGAVPVDSPPWDLTVAVRAELPEVPPGALLLWESTVPGLPLGEEATEGEWTAEDPWLAECLDLPRWGKVAVHRTEPPEGATVLLRRGDRPAAYVWEGPGGRRVAVPLTFAAAREVLLSPDFPLFVHALLARLLPADVGATYHVGEAIPLPGGTRVGDGTVAGPWVPTEPGLYEVRFPDGTRSLVAVNLPPEEIRPSGTGEEGGPLRTELRGSEPGRVASPRWRPWGWALLVVLLVEGALALGRW